MTEAQTAYHEAGHVVVGHALGLALHEVALTHDRVDKTGKFGYTCSPNPTCGYHHQNLRDRHSTVRASAVGCLAGLAAEHVFFSVSLDLDNENARQDIDNVLDLIRDGELRDRRRRGGYVGDEVTWAYIQGLAHEAVRLVKRNRQNVQRIAEALLRQKRLTTAKVEALLS